MEDDEEDILEGFADSLDEEEEGAMLDPWPEEDSADGSPTRPSPSPAGGGGTPPAAMTADRNSGNGAAAAPKPSSSATTTTTSYSLVPVFAVPVVVVQDEEAAVVASSSSSSCDSGAALVRDVYQSYACLFPNPNLNAEQQERDRLLQALSAADQAVTMNYSHPKNKKKRESSSSSWWSWSGKKASTSSSEQSRSSLLKKILDNDDDRLLYTENIVHDNDDGSLLPRMAMDYAAIPIEAHALARYRMAHHLMNFATTMTTIIDDAADDDDDHHHPNNAAVTTTLVDLIDGRTFDVPPVGTNNHNDASSSSAGVGGTTGRSHRVDLPDGTSFVAIGSSSGGGVNDGGGSNIASIVLVYGPDGRPVARIPPSAPVYQHLAAQFFLQMDDDTVLLQIVGLRLLSNYHCLVIARLGGFLEFVSIGGGPMMRPTVAVTTAEYHTDVLGLELVPKNGGDLVVVYGGRIDDDDAAAAGDDDDAFLSTSSAQVFTVWKYDNGDVQLLQVVSLDLPRSSVLFDRHSIVGKYWRTPRSVRLRTPQDGPPTTATAAVTTIHFPTPIVQMVMGRDYWVVVDGLGGITIYDAPDDDQDGEMGIMQVRMDRTQAARRLNMVPIVSAAFQDDRLFLLSKHGDLYCWDDDDILLDENDDDEKKPMRMMMTRIHVSPFARCLLPTVPIRIVMDEPGVTKIALLQTTIGTDTIGMLIQTGNVQQALAVGKHLATPELEACRKESWEQSHDLSILSDAKDTGYVIRQAQTPPLPMSLSLYRSVCHLAVQRIGTARLAELLSFATGVDDHDDGRNIANDLRGRIVASGTYELLCAHLGFDPSLQHFLQDFLPSSMDELTMHFAKSGDISAVSLFWFRHPQKNWFEILHALPLALDPTQYCHLLPVPRTSGENDSSVFVSSDGVKTELSSFPSYVESALGLSLIIDDVDCDIVKQFRTPPAYEVELIEAWFAQRAHALSSFVGSITFTNALTEMAMMILGDDELDTATRSQDRTLLDFLHRFNGILCDASSLLTLSLTSMSPQALGETTVEQLVSMVLADNDLVDSSTIQGRYKHVLVPLLELRQQGQSVDYADLDNAVVSTCLSRLDEASISSVGLDWMNMSVEMLRAGRLSDDEADRIIKHPQRYVDCALSLVKGVFTILKLRPLQMGDAKAVVERIWRIYECLPERIADREVSEALSLRSDMLYIDLIALDICSGWPIPSTNVFEFFPLHSDESDERNRIRAGHAIAALLCKSFCDQLTHTTDMALVRDVLTTLMEDLKDLDRLCFQQMLELPRILYEALARPLLAGQHIYELGVLFEISGQGLIDAERLSLDVLSLYRAAVYGENSSEDEIRVATQCHDALGRWMPSIKEEFAHSGKFLAASHMISSVLLDENASKVLLPKDIRRMNPIEVIDFVLEQNPICFIQHCRDWSNVDWAAAANETTREHFARRNDMHFVKHSQQKLPPLPPLPGIPVFRLAELLGLDDNRSIVAVKSRIILHGTLARLYGPAAAICRTLLADVTAVDADCLPALEATARIVSTVLFRDNATKRELCLAALPLRKEIMGHRKANAVELIARAFEQLEYEWTANGLFEAGAMFQVQRDTQSAYSVSMVGLLISLQNQLRDLVFDDELLMILARYCFFWCIGKATKPVLYPYHPLYAVATDAMLSLASALALHLDDTSRFQALIAEITKVFSSQMANAENHLSQGTYATWQAPDPNLVSRLINLGYSECGARRAVGMTQNAGFDAAVLWAVQHSLDEDFDDPIVLVRPLRDVRLDKESMVFCQTCFAFLKRCREEGHATYIPSGKSAKSASECVPDSHCPDSDNDNEDAWSEDDGLDLDSQEEKEHERTLEQDPDEHIEQDDQKDAAVADGWDDQDDIDLDTGLAEFQGSQEGNGLESSSAPRNAIERDDANDDPIVGGWDDHDEIDLDEVQDQNTTNDGRGSWGDDDVDLSTIVEGEHETSVEAVTPLKVALAKQVAQSVEERKIDYVEKDTMIHDTSILTNGVSDVKENDRSEWDDSVDFADASDAADVGNSQQNKAEIADERNNAVEELDDHINIGSACDMITTNQTEENLGQTTVNEMTNPTTGDCTPSWHDVATSMPTSEPTGISKTNGLLSVNTSLDAIPTSCSDKQPMGDLQRPEPSPAPSYVLPTPPRSAPLPRSKLIQVGQEAFAHARNLLSPSEEERQRLIEQGRAFYQQVKAQSFSNVAGGSGGFLRQEDGSFTYTPSPRSASAPSVTSPSNNTDQQPDQMNGAEQAHGIGDDDWGFAV